MIRYVDDNAEPNLWEEIRYQLGIALHPHCQTECPCLQPFACFDLFVAKEMKTLT